MIKSQYSGFLNTSPIWENKQFGIQQFEFPSVELDAFQPTPVLKKLRLGHQIEHIFKQLIEYSEAYKIVVHNLPVRQNGRTLGEIDFILKDKIQDKLIHVELTYKFYIIKTEISEPIHKFIGPNRRDSFFDKVEKIKNKQFPLLHSPEGSKALKISKIDHLNIEHQSCFKAQLFKPYGSNTVDIGTLNADCLVGYWLRFDKFNKPEFKDAQFYMPSKSEWVIEPHNQLVWKSHSEIKIDIKERLSKEYAPLIWLKKSNFEFEKMFIVWW
jgi:hypothetical protein